MLTKTGDYRDVYMTRGAPLVLRNQISAEP